MRNNYGCDLDALGTGARIGMMRTAKGDLHYFINGQDQGAACSGLPPGKGDYSVAFDLPPSAQPTPGYWAPDTFCSYPEVYAVVDLYGQCVQVSITNATGPMDNSLATSNTATEKSFPLHSPGSAGREGGGKGSVCLRWACGVQPPGQASCSDRLAAAVVDPGAGGGLSLWWGAAKKRGGSSTWTQGLDASLPPKGWDTIAGHGRFGTESCCGERGIRGLEGRLEVGPSCQLPAASESLALSFLKLAAPILPLL